VTKAFCDDNFLRIAPHPPYSPDLAASGSFLFGDLKKRLRGQQFESVDEFPSGVREILDEISADILEATFREWINRLEHIGAYWSILEHIGAYWSILEQIVADWTDALQQIISTRNEVTNDPLS
jgi:hypothetical protein